MSDKDMIETGVDHLLTVLKKHKKMSVVDAAKVLGVSQELVEDWGSFLEDQNYIKKEYFLTKPFFVLKATDSTLQGEAEDLDKKKDGISSKAQVQLASLDQDSKVIGSLKKQFDSLKSEIDKELRGMKVDLNQLEKYDSLKGDIDKKIEYQKKEFLQKMNSFDEQLKKEQKKYDLLIEGVASEEKKINKIMDQIFSVRENQGVLRQKLEEFTKYVVKLKNLLDANDSKAKEIDKNIKMTKKIISKIKLK